MNNKHTSNSTIRLELTRGHYTYMDEADYNELSHFTFYASERGNKCYSSVYLGVNKLVLLHRLIMKPSEDEVVDHINGDGLDNRRVNLRVTSKAQNSRNTKKIPGCSSQYKGVSFNKRKKEYEAYIKKNSVRTHLGFYKSEIQAAKAYDQAATELFGDHANLNLKNRKVPLPNNVLTIPRKKDRIGLDGKPKKNKRSGIFNPTADYQIIPLQHGLFSKVDNEDFDKVNKYVWSANLSKGMSYSFRKDSKDSFKTISLHEFIFGSPPDNQVIDHINNDPLDNRKSNLRYVTKAQNAQNTSVRRNSTSRYLGVSWRNDSSKWCATIRNKKLGSFDSEEAAAFAYDQAAILEYGIYANINGVLINQSDN